MLGRGDGFFDQAVHDGLLEARADVADFLFGDFERFKIDFSGAGDGVADGGFQTAEAEVEIFVVDEATWEVECFGVSVGGFLGYCWSAGVGQAQHAGDFVKCFAGRVVDRAA